MHRINGREESMKYKVASNEGSKIAVCSMHGSARPRLRERGRLVTVRGKLGVDVLELVGGGGLGGGALLGSGDLALVVSLLLDLALGLELVDGLHVVPADLVRDALDGGELAAGLEAEDAESGGDDHQLLAVVGRGDTLVDLQALQSGGTTGGLVGKHASDGLVEDARGSTVVEGTGLLGVDQVALVQVSVVLQLVAEERARDVDELGSHNNDLLAGEELLGQGGGETTEEVSLAVNDVWVCLLEGHLRK